MDGKDSKESNIDGKDSKESKMGGKELKKSRKWKLKSQQLFSY